MAKEQTTSITPEQKAQAAKAKQAEKAAKAAAKADKPEAAKTEAKAAKSAKSNGQGAKDKSARAAQDKERRTIVKVLERAKLEMRPGDLDTEQRQRALEAPTKKAGLSGKALASWVLEGKGVKQQEQEGKAQARKQSSSQKNVTRSKDPEAAELAQAAAALGQVPGAEVRSAVLPLDARAFLDEVLKDQSADDLLSRTIPGDGENEERVTSISVSALEAFARKGEKDKEVRAHLTALGSGTRLWGRKLGLFILAQRKREQQAK